MQTAMGTILRIGLLINGIVGLVLAALLVAQHDWHFRARDASKALIAYFAVSLTASSTFIILQHGLGRTLGRRIRLDKKTSRLMRPDNIMAIFDLIMAVSFLVLHIVTAVKTSQNYPYMWRRTLMRVLYCSGAALCASAMHFALVLQAIAVSFNVRSVLKAWDEWQLSVSQCPTCEGTSETRDSFDRDVNVIVTDVPTIRGDWKSAPATAANENGELEGDRLIAVEDHEV